MSSSRRPLLLVLALALVLGGGGLWLWTSGEAPTGDAQSAAVERDPAADPLAGAGAGAGGERGELAPLPAIGPEPARRAQPVEVSLELVRESGALAAQGQVPLGGGARAQLVGRLIAAGGGPLTGTVRFVAGTNEGRTLQTDAEGAFGASDLYPGLQVVEVTALGTVGALREIRLRNGAEEQLNVGFGLTSTVYGQVIDTAGNPISAAEVVLDGQRQVADPNGEFHFPTVAPGHNVLALVTKPGFARLRQIVPITANRTVPKDQMKLVMHPGCELTVTLPQRLGANENAKLYLLPSADALTERRFPWFTVNPTPIAPGGTVLLEDLPAGTLQLVLFHQGAKTKAERSAVTLAPQRREAIELHLEGAPSVTGKVTRDGDGVNGALVTFQAPDPAMATARALDQPLAIFEAVVLPLMPPGVQRVHTTSLGEFLLTGYWDEAAVRYLTAEGPDGGWAGQVVREEDSPVQLALGDAPDRTATLALDLVGQHDGLPVELVVAGEPRDALALRPGEPLRVEGLAPGQWKVTIRWDGAWIARDHPVTLETEEQGLLFRLPERSAAAVGGG